MTKKTIVLSKEQLIRELESYIRDADWDMLCWAGGKIFGGEMVSFKEFSKLKFQFTPGNDYCGDFDHLKEG